MRIYLSKSNQSNPDDIIKLRDLMKNVTISEYKGGAYNMQALMEEVDEFFQIPPAQEFDKVFHIGRGTTTELDHALNHLEIPCYMYHEGNIYPILSYTLTSIDWQTKFADVTVKEPIPPDSL